MPGFYNPSFQYRIDQSILKIKETAYANFLKSENCWYPAITRLIPTRSAKQFVTWVLETAYLESLGMSTDLPARELALVETSFVPGNVGGRYEISLNQFTDLDGAGVNLIEDWVTQVTQQGVIYPQLQLGKYLLGGEAAATAQQTYDSQVFFSQSHPYNPVTGVQANCGTFSNIFTGTKGSAWGGGGGTCPTTDPNLTIYPGALNVLTSTFDASLEYLQHIAAYIGSIRMSNGLMPRYLRPLGILAPTTLCPRLSQLLAAKSIAYPASSLGAGSMDIAGGLPVEHVGAMIEQKVEGQLQALGFKAILQAPELTIATSSTDKTFPSLAADPTSFYVIAEQIAMSQLGGLVWSEREPIATTQYWPYDGKNADLGRRNVMECQARGRSTPAYGHPYYIFKCKAA
jgi:hypothetical protein